MFVIAGRTSSSPDILPGVPKRAGRLDVTAVALVSMMALAASGVKQTAYAGCVSSGTDEYTCNGSFPSGLTVQDNVPSTTTNVNLGSLTANVPYVTWTPAEGGQDDLLSITTGTYSVGSNQSSASAVSMSATSTAVLQISVNGTFFTSGASSPVIEGSSGAALGGNGGGSSTGDGGAGGIGGGGGGVYLSSSGSISASGSGSEAVNLSSTGGNGGNGGSSTVEAGGNGGAGGAGGFGLAASRSGGTVITTADTGVAAVYISNSGGAGGNGASGLTEGGRGGAGGSSPGAATLSSAAIQFDEKLLVQNIGTWTISTSGAGGIGIDLTAEGGSGGNGGSSSLGNGGGAGAGGDGGDIIMATGQRNITTTGSQAPALFMESFGGQGGTGGAGKSFGDGGSGGNGGQGGNITFNGNTITETSGTESAGIAAYSLGGAGGAGGDGGWFTGGGGGGSSGVAGTIKVTIPSASSIYTTGAESPGVVLQSIGGHAGSGGSSDGVVEFSATGGSAGAGGTVSLNNAAPITTTGDQSPAMQIQSIGGGGGNGGSSFGVFYSTSSGSKSYGGAGGTVTIANSGVLDTSGDDAAGIQVESIGGTGGNGNDISGVIYTLGGGASNGADGGSVTVSNTAAIVTGQPVSGGSATGSDPVCGVGCSPGISAQSIGGGGGNAGSTGSWFSVGGGGGGGGDGGTVTVTNTGASIATNLIQSDGIEAQSVGGGGGNAGVTISVGVAVSMALGGSGGDGGTGGAVSVTAQDGSQITTTADNSDGIEAESVGGGGGNAAYSQSMAVSVNVPAIAVTLGGTGGSGGDGGTVVITTIDPDYTGTTPNKITTSGSNAAGIFGQSVGGGGGNGGFAVSFTGSGGQTGGGISVSLGGTGGSGGSGGSVQLLSDAQVQTAGALSGGLVAQSIGGGGGTGATAFSGNVTNGTYSVAFSLGGSGGSGGDGAAVQVTTQYPGDIITSGNQSPGITAQSIGGGGGSGGWSISGTLSMVSTSGGLNLALGGNGGDGGASLAGTANAAVEVTSAAPITTTGTDSQAILAQSIGGGGGNGGTTISGSINASPAVVLDLALGATGGSGGSGGSVIVGNTAALMTTGTQSEGILAQSVGGGGGVGGLSIDVVATIVDALALDGAIGGTGGVGGSGGSILVTNVGAIATTGASSPAILAQSIGGGGGRGGSSVTLDLSTPLSADTPIPAVEFGLAVGGSGGSGQTGGTVTLTNGGAIMASGLDSEGIVGQSIGGGGGRGASTENPDISVALDAPSLDYFGIFIGGSGGSGANGGAVTLTNTGAITTGSGIATYPIGSVDQGHGIFLQSVGGGGGDGAAAFGNGILNYGLDSGIGIEVSLGGSAGEAGNGGVVTATNSAAITTTNYNSDGIFAQSVGGGGGSGATGILGIITGSNKGMTIGVGGGGGAGGNVTITNNAGGTINTQGDNSIGIFAQSVGGGGGQGMTAIEGDVYYTYSPVSPDVGVAVGDATGAGGTGGTVTVSNAATIATGINASSLGAGMDGILAQSVGGGGGGAVLSIGDSVSNSLVSEELISGSLGDKGASGGTGGSVNIANTGNVFTLGTASIGLFGQSVGGGGGNAITQVGGTLSGGPTDAVDFTLGQAGGSGGNGGSVNLSNAGVVTTGSAATTDSLTISGAHAIVAQSIGAGGGSYVVAGALQLASDNGVAMTLGASLGSGDGGAIEVTNTGKLVTYNSSSDGIFGQSVGGGGGFASSLAGMGAASNWVATANLGASDASGNGGAVIITNGANGGGSAGAITTLGTAAFAIYAQSVGGGGGDAADATAASLSTVSTQSTANATLSLNLGGTLSSDGGSASGNGGPITIDQQSGALATAGIGSAAIFAQSVGGGGGRAGAGAIAASGTISVGGTGLASGNGGAVTVNVSGGSITAGASEASYSGVTGAYGIFAQSVGGGGGIAGNVLIGPSANFGSGLVMGGASTASGNGGAVAINVASGVSLTTFGNSSVGIFAQSVGGGGGVRGEISAYPNGALIGSSGGAGEAGTVTISSSATITTSGNSADGIFAQAAGGSSGAATTTAAVNIGVGGSITASGAGADGIYAQSSGLGAGVISVGVASNVTVEGGGTATHSGQYDGAGIFINQGTSNSIINAGTITSVLGSSGIAILGVDTSLYIDNIGTITGQVLSGTIPGPSPDINLTNGLGGILNAGSLIEANVLNSGLLTINGGGAFNRTDITGNLTQTGSGRLQINVDFSSLSADVLSVGGTASLAGRLDMQSASTLPGRVVTVLSADGGIVQNGVTVEPSALFRYGITQISNDLTVEAVSANFDPANVSLSQAEKAVANGLQAIWGAGGSDAFGRLFAHLDRLADRYTGEYTAALDQLSPGASMAIGARQPTQTQDFTTAMLSCPEFSGPSALVTDDSCAWMTMTGRVTAQRAVDGLPSVNTNDFTYQFGAEAKLAPEVFASASLAFQSSILNAGNGANGNGQSGYGGAALKWQPGAWYVAFAVTGSYGKYDLSRPVTLLDAAGIATASPAVVSVDGRTRAAYNVLLGSWYLRPYVDLDVIYTRAPGYTESGFTNVNLNVATASQTTFIGTPSIEIGRRIELGDGMTLRPFATAGVSVFSDSNWTVSTGFSGAPQAVGRFSTTMPQGTVIGRSGVGVQLLGVRSVDLQLQYDGEYGGNRIGSAGFLTAAWRF